MALNCALSNVIPILGGMIALRERLPPDPRMAASRLLAFCEILGGAALLVRLTPNFSPPVEFRRHFRPP